MDPYIAAIIVYLAIAAYVVSVYEAWMALHRSTVGQWYERYVFAD